MRKIIALPLMAALAAPLFVTKPVMAEDGAYVGLRGGATRFENSNFAAAGTVVENDYERLGYGVAGVAGYEVDIPESRFGYRTELELGYQQAEIASHDVRGSGKSGGGDAFGDTSVKYAFVNAYGDYRILPKVDVFAGGGTGLGEVKFDAHGTSAAGRVMKDKASAWGYHLDAGASYEVTENVALETMYRWQKFVDADLTARDGSTANVDLESHNVYAGMRYKF